MPEQLTKHPDITLQVLRSTGAKCGEGVPPDILKTCPAERFCALPGGEICVYGLAEAGQMTQITAADWATLGVPATPAPTPVGQAPAWAVLAAMLLVGLVLGWWIGRLRTRGR